MKKRSENAYDTLIKNNFHETVKDVGNVDYNVVGGLGLSAVLNAAKLDWDEHTVRLKPDAFLPCLRENGTVRDLDTLVQSSEADKIKAYRDTVDAVIGDEMVASVFGIEDYRHNRRGWFDFVGTRYIDDAGRLYWRTGGIETEIPSASLEPWQVERDGQVVCNILNPISQIGAYTNRSITGVRAKDEEKVDALRRVVMPNDKLKDIPAAYREQYFAFMEQSYKVSRARRLGWLGLKASTLRALEQQSWAERLAQGSLDGALSVLTGKK